MDAAVYGLLGTLAGAVITGLVTLLNNRHQRDVRELELREEAVRKRGDQLADSLKATMERYAVFLSGCWQAERYAEEIIDALRRGDSQAVDRINAIIASPGYQATIASLNDSLGWISISCRDPATEALSLRVSTLYDRLMDSIAKEFDLLCKNTLPTLQEVDLQFRELEGELRNLSAALRRDLDSAKGQQTLAEDAGAEHLCMPQLAVPP